MEVLYKNDVGLVIGFDEEDEFEKWFNSECWILKNNHWICTSCGGGQPKLNESKIKKLLEKGV